MVGVSVDCYLMHHCMQIVITAADRLLRRFTSSGPRVEITQWVIGTVIGFYDKFTQCFFPTMRLYRD
jgi:hypothetical protein